MKKICIFSSINFLFCIVFITMLFLITKLFPQNNEDIKDAYAYPVPCYVSLGQNSVKFVNLLQDAVIYIYTINGENVLTIKEGNKGKLFQAEWDFNEYSPSSDVYIYVITKGNLSKAGKIIIIR